MNLVFLLQISGMWSPDCEKQRRKGKIFPFDFRVPKNSQEKEESLPQSTMQRNRGKQQNGKD